RATAIRSHGESARVNGAAPGPSLPHEASGERSAAAGTAGSRARTSPRADRRRDRKSRAPSNPAVATATTNPGSGAGVIGTKWRFMFAPLTVRVTPVKPAKFADVRTKSVPGV